MKPGCVGNRNYRQLFALIARTNRCSMGVTLTPQHSSLGGFIYHSLPHCMCHLPLVRQLLQQTAAIDMHLALDLQFDLPIAPGLGVVLFLFH